MFILLRVSRDLAGGVSSVVSVINRRFQTENDALLYACDLLKNHPGNEYAVYSFTCLLTSGNELKLTG